MEKSVDLLTVDVDRLFKQHNVAEIDLVHKRLLDEIELKREELRTMVGERYRDLLKAADTIGDMKQTASSIIVNVNRITERCQQLNDHNLIGFRTGNDYQRLQKKHRDHSFHGVIVQIKLLTSLPEMVWSCIDREDYFVATQLFIFARHISTGLNLDTERETMRKFPVAAKQWQVLSQFFFTIENACRDSLAREELSVAVASKSLASWLLLESCSVQETLPMFTERRSKAFLTVLDENGRSAYEKVKDKLLASLHVLIDTVRLYYECFIDDGTGGNRMGGFQRELEHITGDRAAPTIQLIRSEDPMIMQMVPEMIAKFRPRLQAVTALSETEVRSEVSAFLKGIETSVEGSLRRLVSLVPSIKTLHDIKTQAQAMEKPSNWAAITGTLGLPEGTDFYGTFYQRLINDRIKFIVKSAWSETVRQTHADVQQLLQQKPIDLKAYVWKESLDDVPMNLKSALDRTKPSARKLLMKAKAYTPVFVDLVDSLNERLHSLTGDIASFLASSSRAEIDQLLTFFRQCCVEGIADLVTAIKSAPFEPTVERYALLARFLTAVRELCPALRNCFIAATPDAKNVWPGRRSSFAITVSEEDPERWEKVSGLLDEESVRFWTLWMDLFHASWPPLSQDVGYGTLLNDFPAWETVTIEENDEHNQPIQSTIRVPSQPSISLQKFLHHVYELLNAVIPQTIPKPIMLDVVTRLAVGLLTHYDALAGNEFVSQNQTVALQFYLDLRFLQLMFVGRDQKQLNERFSVLIGRFKAYIDPFDFDVFYTHLNANVKRSASKLQHFLGAFVCHSDQLATAIGAGGTSTGGTKLGTQEKNPNILSLSSNSLNVMWFPLLPVVSKDTAILTTANVAGESTGMKDQRKPSPLAAEPVPATVKSTAPKPSAKDATATSAQAYAKGAAAFFGLDKDWFR
ncbi:conserved oligomeric Golgi complex subunit 1 [Anopheles ziemanni]|uniref:conserved oligomeric Golgi complex subunit 1 n=1 Tax=Anopheles coustani TaxID=139045 RepID=UPI0026597E5F|nr:conserved oligomeric Golgi complex subunit 1 [Anopheles coustani]XP_058174533.1 conserved oligomeric Golgi complex subunit 1 [Anopheles ziemanni]